MLIRYDGTNVHAMPFVAQKAVTLRNKKTGKKRTVMKLDLSQSPQDIPFLRPGWNEFPKHVWEQNRDHPGIKKMIKDKMIQVMSDVVSVKVGKKTIKLAIGQDDKELSLQDFSAERAAEIVKQTWNRDMLQRWLDEETRHKVKRTLTKQIKPLLNESKDEDND